MLSSSQEITITPDTYSMTTTTPHTSSTMASESESSGNLFRSLTDGGTIPTSRIYDADMEADSETLIYLKSMLLSLSSFVVGLLYFAAWLTTKNVFPLQRDAARSAALRAYLGSSESDANLIDAFDEIRDFLTESPALKHSICKNFSEFQCQNWFLLVTDRVDSYQELLANHEEYITDHDFKCEKESLGPLVWNPLECPWDAVQLPGPIDSEFQARIDVCVNAALDDAGVIDLDWGPHFHPYFVLGLCRLALHSSFMGLLRELKAVCISGCGVKPSPDVDWSVLCLALSYYASAVRTAYGCTSSREAAKTCEALRGSLDAVCGG